MGKSAEDTELNPSELKKQSAEWRTQILAEAAKAYVLKHPPTVIEPEAPADGAPAVPATDLTEVRYALTLPAKDAMVSAICEELSYHETAKMVLAMRTRLINVKSLRD